MGGQDGVKQQSSEQDEHKISMPSPSTGSQQHVLPPKHATLHAFKKFAYTCILDLSEMVFKISHIRKMKLKHKWSSQLLSKLTETPDESYLGSGGQPYWEDEDESSNVYYFINGMQKGKKKRSRVNERKETPILTATKNGIVEMVIEFLDKQPSSLHETTSDKKNILLVAVFNRQPSVVKSLKKILKRVEWDNLIRETDDKENTMLHLAAETLSKDKTWPVPGSAMQMMWDVKWFEYIKQQMPEMGKQHVAEHFISKTNQDGKTSFEIFKESHEDLVKTSSEWLKDTSESCSVVAALVTSVSFATASTVPGGNGEDGKPPLEGQAAFDAFAISSLIGLCFSATALVMFLSILTSRKQARDFHKDLPLKLLLGLSSLFVSIIAMFIAFCSGHFCMLKDTYKHKIFPLYLATIIPVSFYAAAQFPLYADLLKTIFNNEPRAVEKGHV
ncbi:hypothetical protein RIF29_34507 [Crotalaria pallida]|uniref:PGG domain-containing protein n=1 Tax=Crotalaria pallida TaxID=3830 RepID=A0AAN9E8Z7_CROPI